MIDWLNVFLVNHQELVGLALFAIAFIECLALVGLMVLGTILLFIVAVVAGKIGFPLWGALLLVFLGGLLADLISYGIGYQLKDKIFSFNLLRKNPKWVNMAENCFQRYGSMGLLIGRFVSPLRPIMPMMAGFFKLSLINCIFISFLSSIAWSISIVIPGWVTGAAFSLPVDKHFWMQLATVLAILGVLLIGGIYSCLKQKRWTAHYMAIVCFVLLATLYFSLPHLYSLDNGLLLIIKQVKSAELDAVAQFITVLGGHKVQFILSAILCFLLLFMRQIKALFFFSFTMMGTAVVGWIIKESVSRLRPHGMSDVMQTFSFPSGHTSASFALFMSLGVLAGLGRRPKSRLLLLFIVSLPATIIALSRIYLGVHWATDVVAGGLLAVGICMFVLAWVEAHGKINPLPEKCWKILLPTGLLVLIVSSVISFSTGIL